MIDDYNVTSPTLDKDSQVLGKGTEPIVLK